MIRPEEPLEEGQLLFEGFVIDLRRGGLYRGLDRIPLTPTPFKALAYLAQHPGAVISKEQLLDVVWGGRRDKNTVEQAIRQIRRALGEEKEHPRFIQTIPSEGYRFIARLQTATEINLHTQGVLAGEPIDGTAHRPRKAQSLTQTIALASAVAISGLILVTNELRQASQGIKVANPKKITRFPTHILSPLLGDGVKIFYPQYRNGTYSVAAVPAGGGESATVVATVTNPELCDLTLDGETMLLRDIIHSRDDDEPLYVQPKTGVAHRVGNILAYDAAWYPDAKHILFSSKGVVYVTDLEGISRQQLFTAPGNAFWFRWSREGKRLRFTVLNMKNEESSIWEVEADGRGLHRLFPDLPYYVCCGSWTPDAKYFLFQARVESTSQIWAERDQTGFLLPARSRPFPLAFGAMSYRGPLASKDGRRLFVRSEAPKGELVRFDSKSGEFIPILPSISGRTLAYSKDRNWIAYTSLADNNLWRCRADGTQCLQLTQELRNTAMPRWSPDGQTIAFMGRTFTGNWEVYAAPANGGALFKLSHSNEAKGYPDWSPDGRRLVFSDVPPVSQAQGIYILDLPSGGVITLPDSVDYSVPRWSPDGHSLVALHSGDLHLSRFDFSIGKWQSLSEVPASYPDWSGDGKYIYFRPYISDSPAIFRVAAANGAVEKVASLAGVERGPFFMGDWIGLGPDDSPLAVRNLTMEDIYAWDLVAQ